MKSLDGNRQMLDDIYPIPAGNPAEGSKVMRTINAGLALAVAGSPCGRDKFRSYSRRVSERDREWSLETRLPHAQAPRRVSGRDG